MTLFGSKYLFWIAVIIAVTLLIIILIQADQALKKRKVVSAAIDEYNAWGQGSIKETDPAMRPRLTKYWTAADAPDYGSGAAWSAAFISSLFKGAGAGERFKYASSHSVYIRDAVKNRQMGVKTGRMIGYRPTEYGPKVGDLICYPRQAGITYDTMSAYDSHCDLVVSKSGNQVSAIGGNVSNSVSKTNYALDANGRVVSSKVHAILKNAI